MTREALTGVPPAQSAEPRLDTLSEDDFREVIDALLRNEADEATQQALKESPLVERTRVMLEAMAVSVTSQLEARAADIETLQIERRGGEGLTDDQMSRFEFDYARWRASALRFRRHLMEVLAGLPASRAAQLEDAIRGHRDAIGDRAEAADKELWAHIGDV